ncbi:MAG: ATP-grasp domain-containing protein [Rhodospirillaceae bacterium]|nr:ATP-grasp domain-containing protein [Rhodospirillaceae bacterium]MBT4690373.1 ATP-grasp domain-containing protein [Rhodospirillaceae bacterium]
MPNRDNGGRLLLLVPTTSYRIGDFLAAAERLNVDVAVGSDQQSVLEAFSQGRTLTVDFAVPDRGIAQISAYHDKYPLAAIIGVDQGTTLLAALASQTLGLPHNAPAAIETTENKYRFRSRMANSGLPAPWFTLLSFDTDDLSKQSMQMPYPVVLKPLALSASRGVIRANDPGQFMAAQARIKAILAATDETDQSGQSDETANHVLVESYIPGCEVALEGLLENGRLRVLALFDKPDPLEGPYFEETIYITPSRLSAQVQGEITATVAEAVGTIGLSEGPIHAELRINDGGAWLIEVAARSIGGLCGRTLRFGEGIGLEDLIIHHAMGLEQSDEGGLQPATGVMMIPIPHAGVLSHIAGLEEARGLPAIDDITISIPLGDVLVPVPEGNRYLGFIFATAETPDMVEAALREAHEKLEIQIEISN